MFFLCAAQFSPKDMSAHFKLISTVSKLKSRFASLFLMNDLYFFQTHLWAFNTATLGPLTENLTPVAATKLATCSIPHVSVVAHRAFVQAASFGSSTFITALSSTLYFGLTLQGSSMDT